MNLGLSEMLFIFVIALLIFGPRKLPEISRQIGHALAEYKRATNSLKGKWEAEVRKLDAPPATHLASVQDRMSAEQPAVGIPEESESVTSGTGRESVSPEIGNTPAATEMAQEDAGTEAAPSPDRKSTRLNSSHVAISYAVFCLKKKKTDTSTPKSKA